MSLEYRCKPKGKWNKYIVVAVDVVVKLSINGKFVNGVQQASVKKGYLCLESEGADRFYCGGGSSGTIRAVRRPG